MEDRLLYFNGVDPDVGDYYRQPMPVSVFQDNVQISAEPDLLRAKDLASWIDPRNLAQSGWGVIVHEDEDPDVLAALEPLLALRKEQIGGDYPVFTFLASDRCAYQAFRQRYKMTQTDVDPEYAPYYLLIVGSPQRIPFDFQYELDVTHAVGRLFFERESDYANYARNVVRAETNPPCSEPVMALFGSKNDALTQLCVDSLVLPLADKLEKVVQGWQFETITGPSANKERLGRLLGGSELPALLLTAGHGLAFGKNALRRAREQGSLICSDWEGPGAKILDAHYFGPEDVGPDADFRGSIFFHFGCFTSGTPEFCDFRGPGLERRIHPIPFVAPLSSRILAHENGPLAIIGHVDQAFQYSFLWDDQIHEIAHFAATFHKLASGYPIGAAMEPFNRRFAVIGARLMGEIQERGPRPELKLKYWMGFNDARNYLVLGDPAVRIRVREPFGEEVGL